VQTFLRRAFRRWGLPQTLRVDNGTPWGATGGWPTGLALWVLGLAVSMVWNPARQPQKNGVVERSQGTAKRWGEPHTCGSPAELQVRLTDLDGLQREEYPHEGERSRLAAYPGLEHSGRRYSEPEEGDQWSLGRVLEYLAEHAVERTVDPNGKVSLYDRPHWVGKKSVGQKVYVTIDPEEKEWIFADETGVVLQRRAARELTTESIRALSVARPRGENRGQTP
jgi:hypothetical protein